MGESAGGAGKPLIRNGYLRRSRLRDGPGGGVSVRGDHRRGPRGAPAGPVAAHARAVPLSPGTAAAKIFAATRFSFRGAPGNEALSHRGEGRPMILSAFALALAAAVTLIGGLGAMIAAEPGLEPDVPRSAGYV